MLSAFSGLADLATPAFLIEVAFWATLMLIGLILLLGVGAEPSCPECRRQRRLIGLIMVGASGVAPYLAAAAQSGP